MNINKSIYNNANQLSKQLIKEPSNEKSQKTSQSMKSLVESNIKNDKQNNVKQTKERVDKIDLSFKPTTTSSSFEISKLKSKITAELKRDTSSHKVESLADKINNNKYEINPDEIAKIILKI